MRLDEGQEAADRIAAEVAAAALFGWLLDHLKKRFFPLVSFVLGQGIQRFPLAERVRWGVLVALAVSVLASAFVVIVLPGS